MSLPWHEAPLSKRTLQPCPQQRLLPHVSSLPPIWPLHFSFPKQLPHFLKYVWTEVPCVPLAGWGFGVQWAVYIGLRTVWKQLWLVQSSSWPPPTYITSAASCYWNPAGFCQIQLDEGEQVLDYSIPTYYPKLGLKNSHRKIKEKKKTTYMFLLFSY